MPLSLQMLIREAIAASYARQRDACLNETLFTLLVHALFLLDLPLQDPSI
jgi:hypothetical protein